MEVGGTARCDDQLARLVAAQHTLVAELTPDAVLQRLVELAREVFDVEHTALVVLDPDETPLDVVDTGIDEDLRSLLLRPAPRPAPQPGQLRVLLTAVVAGPGTAYGRLFVLTSRPGPATEAEEELLDSLASTAAVAMENSLLHDAARRGQDVLLAYGTVNRQLLAGRATDDVLEQICRSVRVLVAADGVMVLAPDPDDLEMVDVVADSLVGVPSLRGRRIRAQDSVARRVMATGRAEIVDDLQAKLARLGGVEDTPTETLRHLLAVPLAGEEGAKGAVFAYRVRQPAFDEQDLGIATALARQAAIALERADERAVRAQLALVDLRGRIAETLNRQVVQSIFSIGLNLQGLSSLAGLGRYHVQLAATVESLDEAARGIRATVYPFPQPARRPDGGARVPLVEPVLAALAELAPVLGFEPGLSLTGPLSGGVAEDSLVADVLAVVRESLTNIAKYAQGTQASVQLAAEPGRLVLTVTDDGVGLGSSSRRSGLGNLRRRAEARGGELVIGEPDGGGLLLRWSVPV